jgi:hypothetical protein
MQTILMEVKMGRKEKALLIAIGANLFLHGP